jgi:hypothetical protein
MTIAESIQRFRLRVLRKAVRTGHVAETCRRYEDSRTPFYRWRTRFMQCGADGVTPKRRGPHRGRPSE